MLNKKYVLHGSYVHIKNCFKYSSRVISYVAILKVGRYGRVKKSWVNFTQPMECEAVVNSEIFLRLGGGGGGRISEAPGT